MESSLGQLLRRVFSIYQGEKRRDSLRLSRVFL